MKTTFEHEIDLPNGQIAKRSSESRRYSHGVLVAARKVDGTPTFYVESWSSTAALAMKAADSIRTRLTRYSNSDYGRKEWGSLVSVQAVPVSRFREHVTAGKKMDPAILAKRRLAKSIHYMLENVQSFAQPVDFERYPKQAAWNLDWIRDSVAQIVHDAKRIHGLVDGE